MDLELQYQAQAYPTWSPEHIFCLIDEFLKIKYPDINFKNTITHVREAQKFPSPGVFAIVNPENHKRIILSYLDNNKCILIKNKDYGWYPETIQQLFFCTEYCDIEYTCKDYITSKQLDNKTYFLRYSNSGLYFFTNLDILKPFLYPVYDTYFDNYIKTKFTENSLSKSKDREEKLFFRGHLAWQPRRLTCEKINTKDIVFTQEKVFQEDYIKYLMKYRCGISLNGNAEICNRDIEYMALGMPVIRPLLKHTKMYDDLIPNFHYIAYDFQRYSSDNAIHLACPLNYDYTELAESLINRWNEVKNDYEFLDYIGYNARKWYIKNGTNINHAKLFVNQVDLNLLF